MKIEKKFENLRGRKEAAYMPHIYYGDPNEDFSKDLVMTLAEEGADMLEFGIPFSDPTADGPTFQESCERALGNGITPQKCIDGIRKLRSDGLEIPIVVTTYFNIILAYGLEEFFAELDKVGAQGLIIPNIPLEESGLVLEIANKNDIEIIFQVTPNTSDSRLQKIASASSGFLYVINFEGVTGARESLSDSVSDMIKKARQNTEVPLMAGFGVSSRNHARSLVSKGVDGVITGSALADIYEKHLDNPWSSLREIENFAHEIKQGCIEGYRK